jgi:hypothetical protein
VFLLANAEVALKLEAVVSKAKHAPADAPPWQRWLARLLGGIALAYLAWLAVVIGLRIQFPWDLFIWPESPFMTNMLKLELGQPLFGPPADSNSFVYSPGLEYLTYAVLKPFGAHLDIRYCRLVNVSFGVLAGVLAGLGIQRALQWLAPNFARTRFGWLGCGVAVLVIFRNFTADVTHPDNLVMLHTAGVFLLTFRAWRAKSYGLAIAAMVFAGWGVFAKQILLLAFLGPGLIFLRFNPWGWRKGFLLLGIGAVSAATALVVMTSPPQARFYLLELLPRQGLHLTRVYWLIIDLVTADRAFLLALGMIAAGLLWRSGRPGREYVQFWAALGVFSVCPNLASYVKAMGVWNNLIIFQLWLLWLVWPALGLWLTRATSRREPAPDEVKLLDGTLAGLLVVFVVLLFPAKLPPHRSMYAVCEEIQARVTADVQAGRRVLVGHGMMYLLQAGSREVPLDRANSILELKFAGLADRSRFPERIRQRHYERLYLTVEQWYPPEFSAEIEEHYQTESIVPAPVARNHVESGFYTPLIGQCRVLVPRQP